MFGGHDDSGQIMSDLWLLNTKVLTSGYTNNDRLWTKVEPKGYSRPRFRKTPSIAHLDGKIFLFGQTLRSIRGEVDLFNLSSCKYERRVTCGEEPYKQDCQVSPLDKASKLVAVSSKESSACGLFNRMDVLDTETKPMTWSRVDFDWIGDYAMIPGVSTRFSSATDSSSGLLYIFGGEQRNFNRSIEEEGKELLSTLIVANFSRHIVPQKMHTYG